MMPYSVRRDLPEWYQKEVRPGPRPAPASLQGGRRGWRRLGRDRQGGGKTDTWQFTAAEEPFPRAHSPLASGL
jgi:hypothetical protein